MSTDMFFALSAFMATYKCMQIHEANGGRLYLSDCLKMYGRKYIRLAPMVYIIFFLGWTALGRIEDGPNWTNA